MRPVVFTEEAIIEAGQQLQSAGRNITGFALRQKVGGGNPARLKQLWDEHQSNQVNTEAESVTALPGELIETVYQFSKVLTERLSKVALELNDKAVKAAERRVDEVLRSASAQQAQADRELADAAETVEELERKFDEVQADALQTAERVTQAEADRDAARKEASSAREEAAKLAGKLEAMQRQVDDLMSLIAERQPVQPKSIETTPVAMKPSSNTGTNHD